MYRCGFRASYLRSPSRPLRYDHPSLRLYKKHLKFVLISSGLSWGTRGKQQSPEDGASTCTDLDSCRRYPHRLNGLNGVEEDLTDEYDRAY
jgi:hypothetical protein